MTATGLHRCQGTRGVALLFLGSTRPLGRQTCRTAKGKAMEAGRCDESPASTRTHAHWESGAVSTGVVVIDRAD